ncbi:hypothetical protein ABIF29_001965 [Bradyrhizobium elkanii]|uniref:Uncharacterized protein n=1 Tax=Bradyrhizobium elkanii TaxID=29448 RepID=A0ABV4EVL4_BRAEL|nr:hypothetical protein BLN97_17010 [Bradyrhizobium elkanii]
MAIRQRTVFVIETRQHAAFAFEAASLAQARQLLRTPWLAAAFEAFHRRHGRPSQACEPADIRAATPEEAKLYRDVADEFADGSDRFLVAELPDETGVS